WSRSVADDLSLDFVGSQNNGPNSLGDRDHAGFPGWTIKQITNWVDSNLSRYSTDAIFLAIGTNDANSGASGKQMQDRLSTLIDKIAAVSPNTYLYVSSITPLDAPRGTAAEAKSVADYNALIPALVTKKASQGKRVSFVDAGGSLSVGDINGTHSSTSNVNDGLHPTAAGYDKLGNAWYNQVFKPTSLAGKKDLSGSRFDDRLIGNSGSNFIVGGGGRDEITGGGGADVFGYKDIGHGGDKITDFSSNDLIRISAAGFGGNLFAGMLLNSSSFIKDSNPISTGSKSTFLYNTGNNTLSFDRDGLGSFGAVAIATLTSGFDLQANQIDIVA
ncbi:MAG: GDSL-type esterase/lipase family protein, partial [Phormidesmis sp.]